MKVVINVCFGGFSLSMAGQREYLRLKGKDAFFYHQTKFKHRDGVEEYERIDDTEKQEHNLLAHTVTQDLGKTCTRFPDGVYFSGYEIKRDDLDLIAVVERLGGEHRVGASGYCASLRVVEIPDGVEYEIEEYDGLEHVAEKHRTWT